MFLSDKMETLLKHIAKTLLRKVASQGKSWFVTSYWQLCRSVFAPLLCCAGLVRSQRLEDFRLLVLQLKVSQRKAERETRIIKTVVLWGESDDDPNGKHSGLIEGQLPPQAPTRRQQRGEGLKEIRTLVGVLTYDRRNKSITTKVE